LPDSVEGIPICAPCVIPADGAVALLLVIVIALATIGLRCATDASGTWGSDGTIVFSEDGDDNIYRVVATGGTPSLLVENKSRSALGRLRLRRDGTFDDLRSEPRFKDMLKRLNLPE
jgi:hypothetical protein